MNRHVGMAIALLLGGCSAASSPDYYRLQPQHIAVSTCRLRASLDVAQPEMAPGLDSAHIAVIDRPQHVSFYQDVAWIDTLANLLQAYFIDAAEKSQRFAGVMRDGEAAPAPLKLSIAVRNFEVDQSAGGRMLRVRFSAVLRQGNRSLLRRSFDEKADVSDASIDTIMLQFNHTLDTLTQQMLQAIPRNIGCH